jgi:hypothetical protein
MSKQPTLHTQESPSSAVCRARREEREEREEKRERGEKRERSEREVRGEPE